MSSAEVTVVLTPRERYSGIAESIDTLYANTSTPFDLIVVEGGLPADVKEMIEAKAKKHGFRFLYQPYPLTPNEARNIGVQNSDTRYVVFSDNDVIFTPGWLGLLVKASEEYDAHLVGPTILDGDYERGTIHAAAGKQEFELVNGKRRYHFVPDFGRQNYHEVRDQLQRGPTTMLEFHVMMARRDVFDLVGLLDERISSFADHDDLVLQVLNAGGMVVYEPDSVVCYHDPGTNISVLEKRDLPVYLLRWSDAWNSPSIERAAEKWELDPEDPWMEHAKHWTRIRRRKSYKIAGAPGRAVGFVMHKVSKPLGERMERAFCDRYTRPLRELRRQHAPSPAVI
jgi:GT2 family glycosyltransferase